MMGKPFSHYTVACHLLVLFHVVGKVAPTSPRLHCPTGHRPEDECQVLRSGLREGTVWPGCVTILWQVGQAEGGWADLHRMGLPIKKSSGAGVGGWTDKTTAPGAKEARHINLARTQMWGRYVAASMNQYSRVHLNAGRESGLSGQVELNRECLWGRRIFFFFFWSFCLF